MTRLIAAVLVAIFLAGCGLQGTKPAPKPDDCVLGVPHAADVMQAEPWSHPADVLIAWVLEQDAESWSCPTESKREAG